MAALAQTITIVKGKKVISTSKQLVNIFNEAKSAYREKKAEYKAARGDELLRKAGQNRIGDRAHQSALANSPQRGDVPPSGPPGWRPPIERGYSDSYYANDDNPYPYQPQYDPYGPRHDGLQRTYSEIDLRQPAYPPYQGQVARAGAGQFEQDLAYGELPPPLPPRHLNDEDELRNKMFSVSRILEEVNCVEHTSKAIIKHLQDNPQAMAAVGLTLAEISNMLMKMRPGAALALRGTFPAVVALLLSPEFLIAAGVGLGLTVVALGGYKIVKRIKARKAVTASGREPEELEDVTAEIDHISTWRRGVPEADLRIAEASADQEFITSRASQQLREMAAQQGRSGQEVYQIRERNGY